jgi:hypothetical protein
MDKHDRYYKLLKKIITQTDNENHLKFLLHDQIYKSISNIFINESKGEFFTKILSYFYKIFFEDLKYNDRYTELIFWIQELIINFINPEGNLKPKDIYIPTNYFILINGLFENYKTSNPEIKIEFIDKILELFEQKNAFPFIIYFFNELFEMLIYFCIIEQNKNVNEQGKILGDFLRKCLEKNKDNNYFDKFEQFLLEKSNANQPILTEFLIEWINIIIPLSSKRNCFGNVFIDFMPWIIKTKNLKNSNEILSCYKKIKNEFLDYFDENKEKSEQIKNCILSFIKLIRGQKESNQQEEYRFLNDLIKRILDQNQIIKEIFPFEALNNFLLIILPATNYNEDLTDLNESLIKLIKNAENYLLDKEEFKTTIEKGINNPNFNQKKIALEWYLLIYEKNKNNVNNEEYNKDIIHIILENIDKNIDDKNNENLFLLMINELCKDNILILFDLLSDNILFEKHSYKFKFNLAGYLNNFLIFSSRAKELKESITSIINDETNKDSPLFEKIFTIFSINPMCIINFCIYMELCEIGWELILNIKKINLDDDYYKYLALFVQAIDNKMWNDIRMRLLFPNKNIYFIKCLYGILMLLPQGKAFNILSERLYSIKGMIKSRDNFDSHEINKDKKYISKYIELFLKIQREKKEG